MIQFQILRLCRRDGSALAEIVGNDFEQTGLPAGTQIRVYGPELNLEPSLLIGREGAADFQDGRWRIASLFSGATHCA